MNKRSGWVAGTVAAGLAVFAALTAGCSSRATVGTAAAAEARSPATAEESPQEQAMQRERTLLGAFASIPGAGAADKATFASEQAYESWHVDKSPAAAFAAATARLPRWPQVDQGTDAGPARGQYVEIVQTDGSGTLATQSVGITVVPDGTNTSTLQVTVDVNYRPVKPSIERIPDSSVLTVNLLPALGSQVAEPKPRGRSATAASASETVITSAATIARIASDINSLPTTPRYVEFCPAMGGSTALRLDFAPTASTPDPASTIVEIPSVPFRICASGVEVTIDGTVEPELDDSIHSGLFEQIEQLAGIG